MRLETGFSGCLLILFASAAPVLLAQVTVTVRGTLALGTDYSGVFGFAPGTDLTGQPFTLAFTFDETKGKSYTTPCYTGAIDTSGIFTEANGGSSPGTAVLQIGGRARPFGIAPATLQSRALRQVPTSCSSNSLILFAVSDTQPLGGSDSVATWVVPLTGNPPLTTNYDWKSSVPLTPAAAYRSGSMQENSFSIDYRFLNSGYDPRGDWAVGYFAPTSIEISGTHSSCSSANVLLSTRPGEPQHVYMQASFMAPPPKTIAEYAQDCHFDKQLNWQSKITHRPAAPFPYDDTVQPNEPGPLIASGNVVALGGLVPPSKCLNVWAGCSLIAAPTFFDPPKGSYAGFSYSPYPFYLLSDFLMPKSHFCPFPKLCPPFQYAMSDDGKVLTFLDVPAAWYYSGEVASSNPTGNFIAFETFLVGVSTQPIQGSASCGPDQDNELYCTTLFSWTWNSTFNGTAGGVSQTASRYPIDPGSGTGGITVTSINGVQLPPAVPSNQVSVTASGLAYSRSTRTFNGTITIENISSAEIIGPLQILFMGMSAGVALVNETNNLFGTSYLTVPAITSLAPSQSVTVSVQFANPSNATINLTPVIYSGSIK